jgi:Domain of unknown function (DUF4832)/Domain of unknown function (DUF4874)
MRFLVIASLILGLSFLGCATSSSPITALKTTTYISSLENFPNPERGFMPAFVVGWKLSLTGEDLATWDFCGQGNNFMAYNDDRLNKPLRAEEVQAMRNSGQSMARVFYHLFKYRNTTLGTDMLELLQKDLDTARAGGIKLSPLFNYNFSKGGPDAPLTRVLEHIAALKPILQSNADILAQVHVGLIGCWGEMHTSSNNLIGEAGFNDNTKQIVSAMLEAVPPERFLMVRYPFIKFAYLSGQQETPIAALTEAEAFSGSAKARLGHQDDCIDCGEKNGGTWSVGGTVAQLRTYLETESRFLPHFAESDGILDPNEALVDVDNDGFVRPEHDSCVRILGTSTKPGLLAREHFSGIDSDNPIGLEGAGNIGIARSAGIKRWKKDGCYAEIAKRLGYRLELLRASLPTTVQTGKALTGTITVQNVGFASPFNSRGFELVLRSKVNGAVTKLNLLKTKDTDFDPRLWLPERGEIKLNISVALPEDLEPGMYDLLLNLPDPMPKLASRPEYSIRLANQNAWESRTGFNALNRTLEITNK